MNIKELHIDGYKNLNVKLQHFSDSIAFIGNNGSGKSNLLEALSLIFKSLYKNEKVSFDYYIEYKNSNNNVIKIEKKKSQIEFFKDDEPIIDIKDYLPKKVVAIYSGEEDRLWKNIYEPIYIEFVKKINKTNIEKIQNSFTPQMLYLNKFYWHISLLSLAISDSIDNKKFIKEVLHIDSIDKIKIEFEKNSYDNYSNSPTLEFVKKIDKNNEYKLSSFAKIVSDNGYIPDDVFRHLYFAFTPKKSKIIKDIIIKFNKHLTIEDLSEGEKKLLLLKSALEFAEQEDSLFLLDEPDAHIHINNKEKIVDLIEKYKINRQIIITTHSPTMTQAINEKELYMLKDGGIIDKRKQEIVSDLTDDFWSKQQQNAFLASKKDIILLVEGKHDKIHIQNAFEKLQDEYKGLDFDIFSLGGEKKIQPFMLGLYEAGFNVDVKYIAIYDNDKAGNDTLNKAGFEKEKDNCGYRKLKKDKIAHNNFFAIKLPKPKGFNADCTIENMYSVEKYENAYKQALTNASGHFSNKSIEEISESIKLNSKNILAENSKQFSKEDFKYFRPLFDLIIKIKSEKIDQSKTSKQVKENHQNLFFLKRKNIEAKGIFNKNDNSFTLLKGSQIEKRFTSSTKENYKKQRNDLLKMKKYEEKENFYILQEDIKFKTPSGAAKFVNGGTLNGWEVWKNEKGKTLNEIYRNK